MLTILNGVTARDRIASAYPNNKVLYGLSLKIDAIRTEDGVINTDDGEIQFGNADNRVIDPDVQAVQDCFNHASIRNQIFPDMIRTLWRKFMLNVGVNQVTGITGATYKDVTRVRTNLTLFREAMTEVVTIAKALNIDLRDEDVDDFVKFMKDFSPNGKTSMLQDIEAKRKTEVDYFAGTVIEFGKTLGITTPINHVLYCVIKSMEELY
jgi:2-dehydropantoate 2-reductase